VESLLVRLENLVDAELVDHLAFSAQLSPQQTYRVLTNTNQGSGYAVLIVTVIMRVGVPRPAQRSGGNKSGEEIPLILSCFKADSGELWRGRDTFGNDCIVAIAAEGLETEWVDLGTAKLQCSYDVQAEEMAAMRPERRTRPAALFSTSTICR
jgi:hypothetical protein